MPAWSLYRIQRWDGAGWYHLAGDDDYKEAFNWYHRYSDQRRDQIVRLVKVDGSKEPLTIHESTWHHRQPKPQEN